MVAAEWLMSERNEKFDDGNAVTGLEGKTGERKGRWRKPRNYLCATCRREQLFCWSCACGFMICSDCMEENFWGMTCNGITWTCPDCGAIRGFGND
jgi:hypothetical protein